MRDEDVRARLVATIEARKLCWARSDLECVDQLTLEIDDLLEQLPIPRPFSAPDGHSKPGVTY